MKQKPNKGFARLLFRHLTRQSHEKHLDLNFTQTPCSAPGCDVIREIEGLALTGEGFDHGRGRRILPAKIGLFELPEDRATGAAWSHFGSLDLKVSNEAESPQYQWVSRCPKVVCSGYSAHRDLAEAHAQLMDVSQAKFKRMSLDACELCGTRRAGIQINYQASLINGMPMAGIRIYEANEMRDFGPPSERPVPRFMFRGVLDERGVYHWAMTCPECLEKQQPLLAAAPVLHINGGLQ